MARAAVAAMLGCLLFWACDDVGNGNETPHPCMNGSPEITAIYWSSGSCLEPYALFADGSFSILVATTHPLGAETIQSVIAHHVIDLLHDGPEIICSRMSPASVGYWRCSGEVEFTGGFSSDLHIRIDLKDEFACFDVEFENLKADDHCP